MEKIFTKVKKNLNLKISIMVVFAILIYTGCKKPTEGLKVAINTASLFESPIVLQFENASANINTQLGDFAVTISGKDAGLVQMGSGGSNFKASGGFLSLALKPGVKPSVENPVVFNVYAEIPGYAPLTQTVTVTSGSLSIYQILAVEYAKPIEGTAVVQTQTALSAGTSSSVTIATATSPTLTEVAKIVIPEGTGMLDAKNNVINGTSLKSSVVHYGSGTPSVSLIFPGGLAPTNVLDENGTAIPGGVNFVTAGLLSINMSVGGVSVKKFSKPLAIEQGIPANLVNFETGNPVKAGETIPLWSLDEQTGQWKAEGNGVITAVGGNLVVKYTISHLSSWSLCWEWRNSGKSTVNKSLAINLLPSSTPWLGKYNAQLEDANGSVLAFFGIYQPQYEFFQEGKVVGNTLSYTTTLGKYGFSLPKVPNVTKAKVVVYKTLYTNSGNGGSWNVVVGESAIFNPTTAGSVNVNVVIPTDLEYVDVKVNIQGKCSNKNIVNPMTGVIYIDDKTVGLTDYIFLENGVMQPRYLANGDVSGTIKLIVGHEYQVFTVFDGIRYTSGKFVMSKTPFAVPTGSSGFTATSSFDQTSNTMTIDGSFSMVCK